MSGTENQATGAYQQPDYELTINGTNITPRVGKRLIELRLRESRGEEADQLDLTLDDSDGRMAIPPKGATISIRLGWLNEGMVDKGSFVVDEVEHGGSPDRISVRARSADMAKSLRERASHSWNDSTVGTVVRDIAARNSLPARIAPELAERKVQHIDQTNESDLHFLSRLARQHDAVATVKKGQLIFLRTNHRTNASGQPIAPMHIVRASGDQHRWHTADRTSYTGVRAYWHDGKHARRKGVVAGSTTGSVKTLKDTFASAEAARQAAQSEMQRVDRGAATLSLALALGRPHLMPQAAVTVEGFKPEIDGEGWLVKSVEHALGDGGFTTQIELERQGDGDAQAQDEAEPDDAGAGEDDGL